MSKTRVILVVRPIYRSLDPLAAWIQIGEQLKGGEIIERDEIAARGNENVNRAGYRTQWLLKEKSNFEQIAKIADDQVEEVHEDIDARNPCFEFIGNPRRSFVAHRATDRRCGNEIHSGEDENDLLDVFTRH